MMLTHCAGGDSLVLMPEGGVAPRGRRRSLEVSARRIRGSCAVAGAGSMAHRAAEHGLSKLVPCMGGRTFGGLFIPGLKKTIKSPAREPEKRLPGSVGLAVPEQAAACRGAQATVAHCTPERCEELMAQEPMDGRGRLCSLEKTHLQRSWPWESQADAGKNQKTCRSPGRSLGKG